MRYLSTRGDGESLPFCATVMTGLARDGGLFLPVAIPDVRDRLAAWSRLSYADLAYEIMRLYVDDIPVPSLRTLVERSYAVFRHPEVTPVVPVGNVHILELFHGPTLAFKDVALQFLGNLFEYVLAETGGVLNIVAATSGDTGSAAIYGVRGRDRMRIFVLHPQGRVSPVQERQMTSVLDANVQNLANPPVINVAAGWPVIHPGNSSSNYSFGIRRGNLGDFPKEKYGLQGDATTAKIPILSTLRSDVPYLGDSLRRGLATANVPLSQSSYMVSNDGGFFATNGYGTAYMAHQQSANFGFPDGHVDGLTLQQLRTKDLTSTTKWNALPYGIGTL